MNGTCARCGASGRVEGHHPTGRIDSLPIHVVLVVILCVACHLDEGAIWDAADLWSTNPTLGVLLRRLSVWLARWPGDLPAGLVGALAVVLDELAEQSERERSHDC